MRRHGHNLSLVFSDLAVDTVDRGYAPFVVAGGDRDATVPSRRSRDALSALRGP
ncbi:hypothetical protein [Micromonospora sp. NBC_01739]|uniref:hypothetical protein n=1 Tax=Micromonospora sp. NBC_01739 TaxID=2975985 RepID=UPI003FA38D2F